MQKIEWTNGAYFGTSGIAWSKYQINGNTGHVGIDARHADPDVIIVKQGKRWKIWTNFAERDGKVAGRYLTWRPTLKAAKARCQWAYMVDLTGDDEPYKIEVAA